VEKHLGKGLLVRRRRRWEDNTETDLSVRSCEDGRLMEQAWDRVQWRDLVLAVLNRPWSNGLSTMEPSGSTMRKSVNWIRSDLQFIVIDITEFPHEL
jgi:hypothetical protein